MTTAKLVAPAPQASRSARIAMGGMKTHIPFDPSRQALHAYFYFGLLEFFSGSTSFGVRYLIW
jgi:hypothetical protein